MCGAVMAFRLFILWRPLAADEALDTAARLTQTFWSDPKENP